MCAEYQDIILFNALWRLFILKLTNSMKGVVIEQKAFEKLLSKINLLTDAINFINQTIQKEELDK